MAKMSFNRAPYYDDFDPRKSHMKVLFKPGSAVQARELNVAQSIMSNQVTSFADHIFKNGSKVSNARSTMKSYDYVRLREVGDGTNVEQFVEGTLVRGAASGLNARILTAVNAEGTDPATLYVVYTNTAIDGETTEFVPGETLEFLDSNNQVVYSAPVRCPSCPGSSESAEVGPTGIGHVFTIEEGVFYYEGMFIQNERQLVVVSKYTREIGGRDRPFAGAKIGFDCVQSIVTSDDDPSLLDPSLGYPNATAPGADRYQVQLKLVARTLDGEDGEKFILLSTINENYAIEYVKSDAEYAELGDAMAKRTYETNGDYTIRPFRISFYEHKKENPNDPLGWSLSGSADNIVALLTPSVAYVKGYRVETITDTPVLIEKARSTKKQNTFVKRLDARTSMLFKPTSNIVWPGNPADSSVVGDRLITLYEGLLATGDAIGTARVTDMEKVSGLNADKSAVYRYAVSEVTITNSARSLSDVKSAANAATGWVANAELNASTGLFELQNPTNGSLVFEINRPNIKSLRDSDNPLNGSMSIGIRKKLKATLDSAGVYTFAAGSDEFYEPLGNRTVVYVTNGSNVTTTVDASSANVSISETALTVNLGSGFSGQTVTVFADTLRTNQKEKQKTLIAYTFTTADQPVNTVGEKVMLGKADGLDIQKIEIWDHTNAGNPVLVADVSNSYSFHNGNTDWYYGESYVQQTSLHGVSANANNRLHVTFRYFEHSGTAGFFTVDSYSDVINDPANDMEYKDIPVFVSSGGKVIPLSSAIDFRGIMLANSLTGSVPVENSTAMFDAEYFLPRADLILINKKGQIYPKYGTPSENPVLPKPDADSMVLYQVFLSAYTFSMKDVKSKFIENKRYTMRDIGRLEDRIESLEYYTTLSLLEQSASQMSIKDEDGFDRFKNGLIVDDFSNFQAADLGSIEFKASMVRGRKELRPRFKASGVKLKLNDARSTGVRKFGNFATLPFTSVVQSQQPFATKHISINPYFVYNRQGSLSLSPSYDTWTDETYMPEVVVNVDTGTEALRQIADAAGVLGTTWGAWAAQNSTIVGSTSRQESVSNVQRFADGSTNTTTTTTSITNETIATTMEREGVNRSVSSTVQQYSIEDIVKDVSLVPFARPRVIQFYGANMRPNTRVYATFDGEQVNERCRVISTTLNSDNQGTQLAQIEYGSPMYTDASGSIVGEFSIPAGRFFCGKSSFRLSDDYTLGNDPDMETTFSEATYYSNGLDVTKQTETLNLTTPVVSAARETDRRIDTSSREVVTGTESSSIWVPGPPPAPAPVAPPPPVPAPAPAVPTAPPVNRPNIIEVESWEWSGENWVERTWDGKIVRRWFISTWSGGGDQGGDGGGDPVAQSFTVVDDMFLTGCDVFFQSVDLTSDLIWVEVRQMLNGYPVSGALTRREFKPSELTFSETSAVPHHVEFFSPVFVQGDTDYCLVVGGYSPNTRIWVSKLGQEVVNMPGKIVETQPSLGSSFRSQNGSTWNAEQFEDLKYVMYRAKFTETTMNLVFDNDFESEGGVRLEWNPFEMEAGRDLVRVHWKGHGYTENDRVTFSLLDKTPLQISATDLPPQIGQFIHTATGSGTITRIVKRGGVAGEYDVWLKNSSGKFTAGQNYTADASVVEIRDTYLATALGANAPSGAVINAASGTIQQDSTAAWYLNNLINGVDITELNKEHVVRTVDSADSFIIQVTTPAGVTGRSGGGDIFVYQPNIRYETINLSGAYIGYNCIEDWQFVGCGHGTEGSKFESENYVERAPINVIMGGDYMLDKSNKVASPANETRAFGSSGQKSIRLAASLKTRTDLISPVVDLDSFSAATITNHVDDNNATKYNVAPNSLNRLIQETDPLNGAASFKYVTRSVNLDNPASDLMIYVDYFKSVDSDFDVYIKRVPVYDGSTMDATNWVKLDIQTKKTSNTDSEFTEGGYKCSELVPGWFDGNGEPIQFVAFKIKIVGKSANAAKPPRFKSLRAIAVT